MGAQQAFLQVLTATTTHYLCNRRDDKSEEKRLHQKVHDYVYMRPYYSIEDMCGPMVFGNDEK